MTDDPTEPPRPEGASGRPEEAAPDLYSQFADSRVIDWEDMARENPDAGEEIELLRTVDRIRRVYDESPPPAAAPAETPAGAPAEAPAVSGYRVLDRVGKGGFSAVYRAEDERTGREVALKVLRRDTLLSPDSLRRFLREGRAMARLRHENIAAIYNVIEDGPILGLCMELVRGQPLDRVVAETGPLDPVDVARIGRDLALALDAVHEAGLIHRDVKAENVMREPGGRTVLMDFGISRTVDGDSRVTATGVLVGTPVAMAPEQYEFQEVDHRIDIYALGCLLYRLLTGRHPIYGASMQEIRDSVLSGSYPRIEELRPDVPRKLAQSIRKAMHVDRDHRHENARALATELGDWLRETGEEEGDAAATPRARFPTSVVVLLSAILVTLVGILIALVRIAMR